MKNPNGYGSVVKLAGNRRKPFMARKTVGWTENGSPRYKAIGYYADRREAMLALAEYNRNPYDLDGAKITFQELYEKWSNRDFPKLAKSTTKAHKTSFNRCEILHKLPYKEIKAYQMQGIIDDCGKGYSTQGALKNLFTAMDKFALEMDVIIKANSALLRVESVPPTSKKPFENEELDIILSRKYEPNMDIILILIYTGFRLNELLSLKIEDVNMKDGTITGGSKTKAGKNRVVPIHPVIKEFLEKRMMENQKYILETESHLKMHDVQFYKIWGDLMGILGMYHTAHECRHTFRSRLDSAGANKVCIDLMMGHVNKDVGERVYTHKTIQELKNALLLVT